MFEELDNILDEEIEERIINMNYDILYNRNPALEDKIIMASGAGMNRILQHIRGYNVEGKKVEKVPFIFISAFKYDESIETNKKLNAKLVSEISKEGFGFIRLVGHYIYSDGSDSTEESFFVPMIPKRYGNKKINLSFGDTKELAKKWCIKFDQESVLYGNDKDLFLYIKRLDDSKNIGSRMKVTIGEMLELEDSYSTIKNKGTQKKLYIPNNIIAGIDRGKIKTDIIYTIIKPKPNNMNEGLFLQSIGFRI